MKTEYVRTLYFKNRKSRKSSYFKIQFLNSKNKPQPVLGI